MRTTVDAAGRLVIPKAVRDALGLTPGRAIDVVFTDGRIEIELAPAQVHVEKVGRFPVLVPDEPLPELTEQQVRDALESARR